MRGKNKISLVAICLIAALLIGSVPSFGQDAGGDTLARAQDLVQDLKDTVPYERGPVMEEIEKLGKVAVQPLTDVVKEWKAQGDRGFVSCCMILLGNNGSAAIEATGPLVAALKSPSAHIRYSAARALGDIWAADQMDREPPVKLNGALAATLYASLYERGGAEVYAPVLALQKINDIPIKKQGRPNIVSVPLPKLRKQIGRWLMENPDALPDFEEQPWQLLFTYVLHRPTSSKGQKAKEILIRRQPLGAIEAITAVCLSSQVRVGRTRWKVLADILTGMTQVQMPRDSDKSDVELVQGWRKKWLKSLRDRPSEKYRTYALNKLDGLISEAKKNPTEQVLSELDMMKSILLQQLESPDQLPENISPEASSLLEMPLEIKAEFAKILKALQENEQMHRRLQNVKSLERLASMKSGPAIGEQYLEELVAVTRKEKRVQILAAMSRLLRNIAGVPIVLTGMDEQRRNQTLDEWMGKVKQAVASENEENAD